VTYRISIRPASGGPVGVVRAQAVLLDLDGTLVDTTEAVTGSWRRAAADLGIPFTDVEPYVHGIPADQVLARVAPSLDPGRRSRIAEQVLQAQADPHAPVGLLPGAAALLATLRDHSWAIVTSGDTRLAAASMHKAGVPGPPVLITADDVLLGKPDPEPYLRAADALGVRPQDCLVVEDSPAGVRAGLDAGMVVVALTTTHRHETLAAAHLVARDLTDLDCLTDPDRCPDLDRGPDLAPGQWAPASAVATGRA
jgi:sugar-phosphatase